MQIIRFCSLSLRNILATALIGLAWICPLALAGTVEPPLHMLFSDKNRLVVGTVSEINPPNRIVFKREKVFGGHDDVPELVDLIADFPAMKNAEMGERYVFAYGLIERDKRAPAGVVLNKKGATIITSLGLEPAMFRDTRDLRKILDASNTEEKRDSRALLDLLLKTLKRDDIQLRSLAAAQIALDADLGKLLDDKDRQQIRSVAANPETTTETRRVLLQAAFLYPSLYGTWWQPEAKEVLATTPLDGYPEGAWDPTGLVLLAFGVVEKPEVQLPRDSLIRWLRSPQPLFRERSLALIGNKFPDQEREMVEEVLNDPSLNAGSRTYLDDQMRRLDRQPPGNAAHEQGTE
ncbi:hypothetical protein [Dokdonella sp.]|uniref:hypothetical protein n=1 Tax=Dokdonella sp. TaxID=2291710 RepID=UPI003528B512